MKDVNIMQVSLILPAYNEAVRLKETVNQTTKNLRKITSSFEIVIAEDGNSDGTDKIANKNTKNIAMYGIFTQIRTKDAAEP